MEINYLLGKIRVSNDENVNFIKNVVGKEIEKHNLYTDITLIYEFIKMLNTYGYYREISFFTDLISFNNLKNIKQCKILNYIICSNIFLSKHKKNLKLLDKIDISSINKSFKHRIVINFIESLAMLNEFARGLALLNSYLDGEDNPFFNKWLEEVFGTNYHPLV